jgi:hypothetical protein
MKRVPKPEYPAREGDIHPVNEDAPGYSTLIRLPDGTITFSGLDEALIGLLETASSSGCVAIYCARSIRDILIERDGMTADDANEFMDYNILCLPSAGGYPLVVDLSNHSRYEE